MKFELKSGDSYGYGLSNYTNEFQLKLGNLGVTIESNKYYVEIKTFEDLIVFANNLTGSLAINFKNKIIYLNFSTEITSNY